MEIDEAKLREIIREELAAYKHPCRFGNVTDKDASSMGGYLHSVSRLGNGDAEDGFDIMRENNIWLKSLRESGGWASKIFGATLITLTVGAMLTIIWEGFKKAISK